MIINRTFSNAPWEKKVGYCRAIQAGNQIFVTGTAAIGEDGKTFMPGNAYAQAKKCIEIIEDSLKELGTDLTCIVRTRIYVTDISYWEEFGKAHAEFFSSNPPTTTMVEVKGLISPDMMIEIEADGIIL